MWRATLCSRVTSSTHVPYGIVGCCEIDKHSYGFLSRKTTIDVLCQQGDLVYGRPPMSKACLGAVVDDWFDTGIVESLEDIKGDTQQRYRAVALWVSQWLFRLRDRN